MNTASAPRVEEGVTLQGWLGLALQVVAVSGDFYASNLSCVVIYQGLGSEFWSVG